MTSQDFNDRMKAELEQMEHAEVLWVAISPADRPRYYTSEAAMEKYFKHMSPESLELYKFAKYRLISED
jgi:hypothetical protein